LENRLAGIGKVMGKVYTLGKGGLLKDEAKR